MIGKTSGASLRPQNPIVGGRPQQPQQHGFQDLQFALGQTGSGSGMMLNGMNGMQPGGGMMGSMGQMPQGMNRDMMGMAMMRNGSQGIGRGRQ